MSHPVKITLHNCNEKRRLFINNINYESFKEKLKLTFPSLKHGLFGVFFADEDFENVQITSEEEFTEAVRIMKAKSGNAYCVLGSQDVALKFIIADFTLPCNQTVSYGAFAYDGNNGFSNWNNLSNNGFNSSSVQKGSDNSMTVKLLVPSLSERRRFVINGLDFKTLCRKIETSFPSFQHPLYGVYYRDESNDAIRVTDDIELIEAIRVMKGAQSSDRGRDGLLLRFEIIDFTKPNFSSFGYYGFNYGDTSYNLPNNNQAFNLDGVKQLPSTTNGGFGLNQLVPVNGGFGLNPPQSTNRDIDLPALMTNESSVQAPSSTSLPLFSFDPKESKSSDSDFTLSLDSNLKSDSCVTATNDDSSPQLKPFSLTAQSSSTDIRNAMKVVMDSTTENPTEEIRPHLDEPKFSKDGDLKANLRLVDDFGLSDHEDYADADPIRTTQFKHDVSSGVWMDRDTGSLRSEDALQDDKLKFKEELVILTSMGFSDPSLTIPLLRKHIRAYSSARKMKKGALDTEGLEAVVRELLFLTGSR
jgi:hypothetical protein